MDRLNTWFVVNKLSLNLSKAIFMFFSNCKTNKTNTVVPFLLGPLLLRPPVLCGHVFTALAFSNTNYPSSAATRLTRPTGRVARRIYPCSAADRQSKTTIINSQGNYKLKTPTKHTLSCGGRMLTGTANRWLQKKTPHNKYCYNNQKSPMLTEYTCTCKGTATLPRNWGFVDCFPSPVTTHFSLMKGWSFV